MHRLHIDAADCGQQRQGRKNDPEADVLEVASGVVDWKLLLLWVFALCGVRGSSASDYIQARYQNEKYMSIRENASEVVLAIDLKLILT